MNFAKDDLNGKSVADRFGELDARRRAKLDRARTCSTLTLPSVLPPENWSEDFELPQPYSSTAGRGVTALSSRMLSALIPLNDLPFFAFAMENGAEPDPEISNLLDAMAMQVYDKMSSKNIRDAFFQALQSLIIVGDVAVKMEEDYTFRCIRLDQYCAVRDVTGDLIEFVHLEFIPDESPIPAESEVLSGWGQYKKEGFITIYCRYVLTDDGKWHAYKETEEGRKIDEGEYDVFPYAVLRWNGVIAENYGRSKCEEIYGDIKSLEAYTEAMIYGMAAASTFFIGVNPNGVTELGDIAEAQVGDYVAARPDDTYILSPAETMNPQIQATQQAIEMMRREIGEAFLMNSASIRQAERVTATEVRMVGQELENVLGGAFSSIARDLLQPMIRRCLYQMLTDGDIDPRLEQEFFGDDGKISIDIVTGLQALSRDSDLQRLMQMGEMMRNLPPEAVQHFKYEEYAKSLISSLGFDPRMWVKSEEEVAEMRQQMMAEQNEAQTAGAVGQATANAAGQAVGALAPQVMEQVMTGGASPMQGGPSGG